MRLARKIWLLVIVVALSPALIGWGYEGHRKINYVAAFQLKGSFGRFLTQHADELKIYGAVPDYQKGMDRSRYHHHFIDTDYYGAYPFNDIPRTRDAFYEKFGADNIKKMGDAPFFIEKLCSRIIYLMKNDRFEEALYNMGELGHYVSDLHQPLHVILNYNGKKTGNNGVHFRWEVRLIDDYIKRINPVGTIEKIDDPVSFAFDIIKESFSLHQKVLDADTKARKVLSSDQADQLPSYDVLEFEKPYLDLLYSETKDLLADRLGRSVIRVASIWQFCWEQAGKPELPQ